MAEDRFICAYGLTRKKGQTFFKFKNRRTSCTAAHKTTSYLCEENGKHHSQQPQALVWDFYDNEKNGLSMANKTQIGYRL